MSILCGHLDEETLLVYLSCPKGMAAERQGVTAGGKITYANYFKN